MAEEIIKEMCLEMNIFSEAEQHEFTLCYILENDDTLRVLNNDEYILDMISELESRNEKFTLILTRTVWIYPLREDNEFYINTLFFQIVPNYMAGLLTILPTTPSSALPAKTLDDAANLGALLYFASDAPRDDLSENLVLSLIPRTVIEKSRLSTSNWLSRISHKVSLLPPDYDEQKARLEFLSESFLFYVVNKTCLQNILKTGRFMDHLSILFRIVSYQTSHLDIQFLQ